MDSIPKWFPGVSVNFAENVLYTTSPESKSKRSTRHKEDGNIAIVEVREGQSSKRSVSWGELRDRTAIFAAAMRANGVEAGDRVAVVMSNALDTLCVFLGATSLGAIFSSSSTDMGAKGILERLRQIEPRWVFVEDAALYNGKRSDLREKMRELVAGMKNVKHFQGLISVPWGKESDALDVSGIPRTTSLKEFIRPHLNNTAKDLQFSQLPFHAPFLIVYSSGTTGTPKCIVHSAGGVLLSMQKEGRLHRSLDADSVVLQFTTTGWIMYLAAVVSLVFGARLIMYDGSPFLPGPDAFIRLAGEQRVTNLGVSPRWFQTLRTNGIVPRKLPGTEALRVITCTGMVLPPELFRWFYSSEGFHPHTQLGNIAGGTDLAGAFGDCNPLDPVVASGGCQGWSLGLDVRVFDASIETALDARPPSGRELPAGEPGELVCTTAFPNMPVMFWGDSDGKKYHAAYFQRFDDVWAHGDFVQVEPLTRSIVFLGRADGVLNPSGVRFGSAEIYAVLETMFQDVIEDSVCVGQRRKGDPDESVMLFLKMKQGNPFTPDLVNRLKDAIAQALSKRHVPKFFFETPEIPV
jgi:acetoacetyl-CoA synthetase